MINSSTTTIELFYAKKSQVFEKYQDSKSGKSGHFARAVVRQNGRERQGVNKNTKKKKL